MCYSGKIFTYRLDRTTVTVGGPRMLAMSTSPASVDTSSCASLAACSSAVAVVALVLPSTTGAGASATPRAPPRWEPGHDYLQPAPPPYQSRLRPPCSSRKAEFLQAMEFHRQHITSRHKYSTTLLKESYLLRCGLHDLKLLGHALAGHVARPPWRRRQTSL
jgi:hypothetical protein